MGPWDFAEVTFTDLVLLIHLCIMDYRALVGQFKFTECVLCDVVSFILFDKIFFFTNTSMTSIITHQ
jgi:hypothetical protein